MSHRYFNNKRVPLLLIKILVIITLLLLSTSSLAKAKFVRKPGATLKLCYFYFGTLSDLGYTFAFHTGRLRLQEDLKALYPDILVESLYENKVFTSGINRTQNLLDYVSRGCHMIISNSNENFIQNEEDGDENFSIWAATQFPNVSFLIGGGSNAGFRSTRNMIRFSQDGSGGYYLAGVAAAHEAKRCIAFISAYERSISKTSNGFVRGIRSVNPDIPIHIVTLNSFYRPAAETRIAKLLMTEPTEDEQEAVRGGRIPATHLRGCNVFGRMSDPHSTDEAVNERLTYKSAANVTKYFSIAPSVNVGLYVGDSVLTSVYTRWDLKLIRWIRQVIETGAVDRGSMADDEIIYYGLDGGYMVPAPLSPLASLATHHAIDSLLKNFTEDQTFCGNISHRDGTQFTPDDPTPGAPGNCMNRTMRSRIKSYLDDPNTLFHEPFREETDCPPGTYFTYSSTGMMVLTCTPCPEHTFSEAAGSSSCIKCPENFEAFGEGNAICQPIPIVQENDTWARAFAAVLCSIVAFLIATGVLGGRLYFRKPYGVEHAPLDGSNPFSIVFMNTTAPRTTIVASADAAECFVLQRQTQTRENELTIVVGRTLPQALTFLHELQETIMLSHVDAKHKKGGVQQQQQPRLLAAINYGHGSITPPQHNRDEPEYTGRVVDVACELFGIASGLHDTVASAILTTAEVAATTAELSSRSLSKVSSMRTPSSGSTNSVQSFSPITGDLVAEENVASGSSPLAAQRGRGEEEHSTMGSAPPSTATPHSTVLSATTFRAIGDRKFKGGIIRRVASMSIGTLLQHPPREDVLEAQERTMIIGNSAAQSDDSDEEATSLDTFLPIPKHDLQTEMVLRRGSAIHIDCSPATTSKDLFYYHESFAAIVELCGGQVEYVSGMSAVGTFGVHRANILHEQNACQCALKLQQHLTTTICVTSGKMASCTQQQQNGSRKSSHDRALRTQSASGEPISFLHVIAANCGACFGGVTGCTDRKRNKSSTHDVVLGAKSSGGSSSVMQENNSFVEPFKPPSCETRIFVQECVVHPTSFLSLPHDVLGLVSNHIDETAADVSKVVVHELFSEQSWPFSGNTEDAVAFKDSFQKLRNGDYTAALKQYQNIAHHNRFTSGLHAMIQEQMGSNEGVLLPPSNNAVGEAIGGLPPKPRDRRKSRGYFRPVAGSFHNHNLQSSGHSNSLAPGFNNSNSVSFSGSSNPVSHGPREQGLSTRSNPLLSGGGGTHHPGGSGLSPPSSTSDARDTVTQVANPLQVFGANSEPGRKSSYTADTDITHQLLSPKCSRQKLLAGEVSNKLVTHQNTGVVEDECGGLFSMFIQSPTAPAAVESDSTAISGPTRRRSVVDGEVPSTLHDVSGTAWLRSAAPIAAGSYACVYRAINEQGSTVCIKLFDLEGRKGGASVDTDMIAEEVSTLATYTHENIIGYITYGFVDRYAFIVMEHAAGGSLRDSLNMFTRFSIGTARNYFREALRGLEYLHSQNVIHCDVKPHNILIGSDGICKIADFGSTVVNGFGDSFTTGHIIARGTAPYMSPEACRGQEVAAGDIWSIGISMIEMLTGALPWGDGGIGNVNHFIAKLGADEKMKPQIPYAFIEEQCSSGGGSSSTASDLVELLEACLARDPSCRPTATEVLRMRFFQ